MQKDVQMELEPPLRLGNKGPKKMGHQWKGDEKPDCKLDGHYDKFIKKVTKIESLWNGHWGYISVGKQYISRGPGNSLEVPWIKYRAGLSAHVRNRLDL